MGQDGLVPRYGFWHTNTTVLGRRLRVSLHTRDRKVARVRARQLVADLETRGPVALQRDRATVADALALAEADARVNERKSAWKTAKNVERLGAALGHLKLASLTGAHIMAYIDARKAEGFANASVNRELATLRRALILAVDAELVARIPRIRLLKEAPPRSGFFEATQYTDLLKHLPEHLRPLITTAFRTGWRIRSELLPLQWHQVDLQARTLRLAAGTTKSGDGRVFVMPPALHETLVAQRAKIEALQQKTAQVIPWVFVRPNGRPIKSFRRAWITACKAAGIPGRIPHDLRRTAVRNLERAGVPRSVAMKMVGHRTESIYRRYAIVSESDLHEAAKKLAALESSNGIGPHVVKQPRQPGSDRRATRRRPIHGRTATA